MLEQIIIIGFGVFLFVGAYFGAKKGSRISLIMGVASGALVLIGDLVMHYNQRGGFLFLMTVAGLLIVSFLQRVLKTRKMMPAGMLLAISLLFFVYILFKFLNNGVSYQ